MYIREFPLGRRKQPCQKSALSVQPFRYNTGLWHTRTQTPGKGEGRQLIPLYSIASSRCTFVELSIPTSFRFVFIVTGISKISF